MTEKTFEEQALNWYVYNSFLNNNIWFNGTDIWKGLLAKQKHEVHPAAGREDGQVVMYLCGNELMNMNYFKLKLLDNLLEDYQSHYLINIHKPQEFNSVLALRYNIMLDLHYYYCCVLKCTIFIFHYI